MIRPESERPDGPDPTILDLARASAEELLGAPIVRYEVGDRLERPNATLFLVRAWTDCPRYLPVYYKVYHPPKNADTKMIRARLECTTALSAKVRELFDGTALRLPVVLAADSAELTEVVTAISGQPLGKVALGALPGRRSRTLESYELIGQAIALISKAGTDVPGVRQPQPPPVDERMEDLEGMLDVHERNRLGRLIQRLYDEASRCNDKFVLAHGDLSIENVLVDHATIGIIDPAWVARWPGYDLARLWVRLDYEYPRLRSWNRRLLAAALAGYGEPALPETPAWRFRWLWEVTRTGAQAAGRTKLAGRVRAARVRRNLRAALNDAAV